jgi:t-SNARE complex subunit (syntaxin)
MNKKITETSNADMIKNFVKQLEDNVTEFTNGIRKIDPDKIPKELKPLLEQIHSDVFHFIDNYWMTIHSFKPGTKPPGEQKKYKEREFIHNLVKKYQAEKGDKKYPPFKYYLRALDLENHNRKKKGDISLSEISEGTYITIKKEILDT